MYEEFFGLREKPFTLLADPSFLYLSRKHATALSLLEYALSGQAGFCVITGEVGSGKTTLLRQFLQEVDARTTPGVIFQTHRDFGDILRWVLLAFGIEPKSDDRTQLYQNFLDFLIDQRTAGRRTILIVDEAQNLSVQALEELRLLSNVNFDKFLFLQIILVGQPELLEKLRLPELRQFAQRVAVHYDLGPLTAEETRNYIAHRMRIAGAQAPVFNDWAVAAIYYFTQGVPRLINSLCDMALVYAFADGRKLVDLEIVSAVVADREASGLMVFAKSVLGQDEESLRAQLSPLVSAAQLQEEASAAVKGPQALASPFDEDEDRPLTEAGPPAPAALGKRAR
ncbi:MAG: AAA family ATPase [Alphaproteobacteria bacterium]|nr:AAA family ATPase [Alphaproteobacteria bacterium]